MGRSGADAAHRAARARTGCGTPRSTPPASSAFPAAGRPSRLCSSLPPGQRSPAACTARHPPPRRRPRCRGAEHARPGPDRPGSSNVDRGAASCRSTSCWRSASPGRSGHSWCSTRPAARWSRSGRRSPQSWSRRWPAAAERCWDCWGSSPAGGSACRGISLRCRRSRSPRSPVSSQSSPAHPLPRRKSFSASLTGLPAVLLSTFVIVGLFEELGWRGYALRTLQRSHSPLWSALVVGAVWLSWHLPELVSDPSGRRHPALRCLGPGRVGDPHLAVQQHPGQPAHRHAVPRRGQHLRTVPAPQFPDDAYLDVWWLMTGLYVLVAAAVIWRSGARRLTTPARPPRRPADRGDGSRSPAIPGGWTGRAG